MLHINCIFDDRIPKKQESIDDCQDHYEIKANCLAIADGASQSFYPSVWAELLVKHFCDNPQLDEKNWKEWLLTIQEKWLSEVTQRVEIAENERRGVWVTNKNRLLRREAATSTFVGLELINEKLRLSVVGDSCFFIWQRHQDELETYILRSPEEFDDRPEYFGSYPKDNKFAPKCDEIDLKNLDLENTFFFLATDALAEWILKNKEQKKDIFSDLLEIDSSDKFKDAMSLAREDSEIKLKNDDTTLLIFQLSKKRIQRIKKEPDLPELPEEKKSNAPLDEQYNSVQIFNSSIEEEDDLSQNSKVNIISNNHNTKTNIIQNIYNKIFVFFQKKKSTVEHELSNIDQLNNEHDQTQIPNDSILPQKDIYQLQRDNIYLKNSNQQLITTNKRLSILFTISLLGCMVLTVLLFKTEPETNQISQSPETAEQVEGTEKKIVQTSKTIDKGTIIYNDKELNSEIINSLSNDIKFTVKSESPKDNSVQIEASFFIKEESIENCPDCAKNINEINVKSGSSIWKNFNISPRNKIGVLVKGKRFVSYPDKTKIKHGKRFIPIKFIGYIKKD